MIELIASIIVDVSDQKLYAYDQNGNRVFSTLVSTGKESTPTPLGEYTITTKYENVDFVGDYGRINLDNVMCLDGDNIQPDMYCMHPKPNEHQPLGTPWSLGCIRMGHKEAKWMFDNTQRYATVIVKE